MNLISNIFISLILGLIFALGLDATFLHLLARPFMDQVLLVAFPTAAFGYLTFSFLRSRKSLSKFPHFPNLTFSWAGLFSSLREHFAGLVLALLFVGVYLNIGLKINNPHLETVNNYFDADNSSWMARITAAEGYTREMRGPHPYAYLIFRPLGWLFNLFTQNPALSVVLLTALAGGLCVFLAWVYIKDRTDSRIYALLIAALLGLSTSTMFFGSVVETYIFSAATLIGFFVLLQRQPKATGGLIGIGLITFGITFTNFIQEGIGFFVSRVQGLKEKKNFWTFVSEIAHFAGVTISLGVLLSLLHAILYPAAKLFFVPSSAVAEEKFVFNIFQAPTWRVVGRIIYLMRTIVLYTVVAPHPYVFTTSVGGIFPRFNFFKIAPEEFSFSSYAGLGKLTLLLWGVLLLAAGILFLWNLIRTRKVDITLAFVLCILFNFILHLNYGYELFLYSADWTYALVFFVGIALAPLAGNRYFQVGLLLFLVLLAYNQMQFFKFIFDTIAPFGG